MKKLTAITTAVLIALSSHPIVAGTKDPGVHKRQQHQVTRIKQGVKSGSLTPRETHKLGHEVANTRKMERRFKSDGQLTATERARLHQRQNKVSRDIYREKHDGQRR